MIKKYTAGFVLLSIIFNIAPLQNIAFADADITPPVIEAHADVTAEATSAAGAVVIYTPPNAIDDVDGTFVADCAPASDTLFALGDTIVTCEASDVSGSPAVPSSFTVTVEDTTSPVISLNGDAVVEVIIDTVYIDAGATAEDIVSGDLTGSLVVANSVNTSSLGSYAITYNVSDSAGNPASEVLRTVNVVAAPDTVPPAIDAHADITVEATSSSGAIVTYTAPNAIDDVDGTFAATCLPTSGSQFALGATTVTCNASDVAGNPAIPTTFTVTVQDTIAPTATLSGVPANPANTASTDITVAGADVTHYKYKLDGGSFGAETPVVTPITESGLSNGTHTISVVGKDAAGNWQEELSATVFIWTVDTIAPIIGVVTPVPTPANDPTPSYTFSATEAGAISYSGGCSSAATSAGIGNNTITFVSLTDGTYAGCSLTVTDAAGNVSLLHAISPFAVDATPPTLTAVTPVPTPTNDTTPSYTFSTNEAGTIAFSGGCESPETTALVGSNTITFNTLPDGTYPACAISVTDHVGNVSNLLTVSSFTVDTIAPVAALVNPPAVHSNVASPDFTVDNTETTHYRYKLDGGSWSSEAPVATHITASGLSDGPHTLSILAKDLAGNWQTEGSATVYSWSIDTVSPTIAQVTPVSTPTNDSTPNYTFISTEVGTITYGGGCASATTAAVIGNNIVTFAALADGTYASCTLTVTDVSGNNSNTISISSFTVDTGPSTAVLSGTPPDPTIQTAIDVTVAGADVVAYKYKLDDGSYSSETSIATHIIVAGLTAGTHTLSVVAKDSAGNWQTEGSATGYTWSIDLTPPTLTEVTPIPNPTNDATPDYTFSATEAGTIAYAGGCASVTTIAVVGNNTVTFNLLADGTHAACTIRVTDSVGNVSSSLAISSFTITTVAPVAVLSGLPTNPVNATTTDITVGGASVTHYKYKLDSGVFGIETPIATHIQLSGLVAGSHTLSVVAKDTAGNWQAEASATSYTWAVDRTLVETVPVPTVTNNRRPLYKFISTKIGTLTYGGGCTSSSTFAFTGENTIQFRAPTDGLADGLYDLCTITHTDPFLPPPNNKSAPLFVTPFTIDTVPPVAVLSGTPLSATNNTTADITVGDSSVVNYKYKLDGGSFSTVKPVAEHILLSGLGTGSHTLLVVGQDAAGNWQTEVLATTYTWSIDLVPPVLTPLSDDFVPTSSKTWVWGSDDPNPTALYPQYRFLINQLPDSTPVGAYSTTTTVTKNTGVGTFYIHVQAIDAAGNESLVVHASAVLDTLAPSGLTLTNTPPAITAQRSITVTVTGSADAVRYKYKIDAAAGGAEHELSVPIQVSDLPAGVHALSVIARDSIGNWQADADAAVYTWRILAAPSSNPTPGRYTAIVPSVTLSAASATGIRYTTDGTTPTCTTGTIYSSSFRIDTTRTLTAISCDAYGVASEPAAVLSYTIDLEFTDEQLSGLVNLGVLGIPNGFTSTSTPTTTAALGFTVLAFDSSTIQIPAGTVISSSNGTNFDVAALHNPFVSLLAVTGLGANSVVDGVLQWGIEGASLAFSNPITIKLYVGTGLNGSTLLIKRSALSLPSGGWEADGIGGGAVCVVSGGFCTFTATKASYYAAYHVEAPVVTPPPSSGGGSSGGGSSSSGGGGGGGGGVGVAPGILLPSDGTVIIANGVTETATTTVSLALSSTNATKMALSNASDFKGSFWQDYATSTPWILNPGDGLKTVYVRFRNDQGVAKVVTDTIMLKTGIAAVPVTTTSASEETPTVLGFQYEDVVAIEKSLVKSVDASIVRKVIGLILLQVQDLGRAWYVDPISTQKFYLADGPMAYQALRKFGYGITNADLAKIPIGMESRFEMEDADSDGLPDKLEEAIGTLLKDADSDADGVSDGDEVLRNFTNPLGKGKQVFSSTLVNRLKGRIVLQVESRGEAWYIYPVDGKRYYLANGEAAYQIMRFLSLGITNENLRKISVGTIE